MKYENADKIFPEKLLLEIRQFMPEGYVYIPPQRSRKKWGVNMLYENILNGITDQAKEIFGEELVGISF